MHRIVFSSAAVDPFDAKESESDSSEEPSSPVTRIREIVKTWEFAESLMSRERGVLRRSLDDFSHAYPDTPTRRLRAHKINETLALIPTQFRTRPPDPQFHWDATPVLRESDWAQSIITTLKAMSIDYRVALSPHQVMPRLINMKHIVEGEMSDASSPMGLHFCPPGSLARMNMRYLQRHPRTGVMCGEVTITQGAWKFSTIFPDIISTQGELVEVINSGIPIAREKNAILLSSVTQPSFHFETLLNREGFDIVSSAYPIFDYSRLRWGQPLEPAFGVTLQPDELIHRYAHNPDGAIRKYGYFQRDEDGLSYREVYDIATLIPEANVKQGIYVDVGTGFIPDARVSTGMAFSPTGMAHLPEVEVVAEASWSPQTRSLPWIELISDPNAVQSDASTVTPGVIEYQSGVGSWDILSR